ncbi:PAS domain S-box protein [Thermodesulfobacteriota bacterium]
MYHLTRYICYEEPFKNPQGWLFHAVVPFTVVVRQVLGHVALQFIFIAVLFVILILILQILIHNRLVLPISRISTFLAGLKPFGKKQLIPKDMAADTVELASVVDAANKMIVNIRAASAQIAKSEERFRATFEQAAVGVAHVAPDGKWLQVNEKLCEIVGHSVEELYGLSFQDITHPDDLETDLEYVSQMLENKINTYSMRKRYFRKDGSIIWILLTVSLVRDTAGNPEYFISVIEDISRQIKAEEELEMYHKNLEDLVKNRTNELNKTNTNLQLEINERKQAEADKERLIAELQKTLAEVKSLRGILPLCSFCKKIRNDENYWEQVDVYIHKHSEADISHSICPDCVKVHYPHEYRAIFGEEAENK